MEAIVGGTKGGGASLSALGGEILAAYRLIEQEALAATAERLDWLRHRLRR